MKILVRRKGFGIIKPPDDITKFIQGDNSLTINPKWTEFHREQSPIRAVTIIDGDLEVGEYEAKLTWQYYNDIAHGWFATVNPQDKVVKGWPVRLVYLKQYKPSSTLTASIWSDAKCGKCKALLYKYEEEAGVCNYCNTDKIVQKEFSKSAIL